MLACGFITCVLHAMLLEYDIIKDVPLARGIRINLPALFVT